ncbi:MAG: hypothetical protein K1X74_16175 [Pirellulales bacterium]|nr:hypothetical protein [Pirellulales bacterium]
MDIFRTKSWLLFAVIALAGSGTAAAQLVPGSWVGVEDLQFFAPPDVSAYSGGPDPKTGWFATLDEVNWWLSTPKQSDIGVDGGQVIVADGGIGGRIPETFFGEADPVAKPVLPLDEWGRLSTNGLNTTAFTTGSAMGERVEFGCVDCDGHWGIMFGGQFIHPWTERVTRGDVDVVFLDTYVPMTFWDLETGLLKTRQVGYLDGFVNRSELDVVDDSSLDILLPIEGFVPVANFAAGRYYDGNGDGVIDPTNIEDNLSDPVLYDLDDLYRLPVVYNELRVRNQTKYNNLEVMPFYRLDPFHNGSLLEVGTGMRYSDWEENFDVQGWGGILGESDWYTRARNRIVGPQVSARWSQTHGHWTLSAEGRGFVGWNFQSVHQTGGFEIFSNTNTLDGLTRPIPPNPSLFRPVNTSQQFSPNTFEHDFTAVEFSPGAEVRLQTSYQLTKAIAIRGGWTANWQDALARPSNMVLYKVPFMGIRDDRNTQDVFFHGFNIGVEVNR